MAFRAVSKETVHMSTSKLMDTEKRVKQHPKKRRRKKKEIHWHQVQKKTP